MMGKMKSILSAALLSSTTLTAGVAAFSIGHPHSKLSIRPLRRLSATFRDGELNEKDLSTSILNGLAYLTASSLALTLVLSPLPSHADGQTKEFKLPPIDYSDKTRCTLSSSSMGQANAARDKLYDLRQCDLRNAKADGFDLSGVITTNTNLSGASLREAQFSKGYLRDSNFENADFTNAIVDRASFKGSSLKGAIFSNAVLTATSFEGANVEGADFTEAYIGDFDSRTLCRNPTLKGENPTTGADTRLSANCGPARGG